MQLKLKYYFEKLLTAVRVRPIVAGLEISDSTIRLAYFDGAEWHLGGVRLEPGVIEGGKLKSRDRFIEALKALKLQVFGKKYEKRKISVVASLSSISIYSQVFSLPIIKGENLEKAIQLNIQMVSPVDVAQAYSGWQTVGEDQRSLRLEILSSFIDKSLVDEMSKALEETGFLLIVLESRALSLSRLLREQAAGVEGDKPYILISLDDSGLDFLIIRHGHPYFEYFTLWKEVTDDKGQISEEAFRATVTRNLYQVLNFYGQHWPEAVAEVIISATALKDEVERIIKENFPLTTRELQLKSGLALGAEWFVALGCGVRGSEPRAGDKEMSLLGIGAEEEFRREQFLNFTSFWRLLMPIALGLLLVSFFVADLFLLQTKKLLESESLFSLSSIQAKENQLLQADAQDFNRTVALVGGIQEGTILKSSIIERVDKFLRENDIVVSRLYVQSVDNPITLNGETRSEDKLAFFKKAMEGDGVFKNVNLPLSDIKKESSGVTFSMTFGIKRPE